MAIREYLAIIEVSESGGFGVFFPDFPGCVSAGEIHEVTRVLVRVEVSAFK